MNYRYVLYDPDFSTVLVDTEDNSEVEKFLRDSDFDGLPIKVEWGQRTWKERWTGRIELHTDGSTSMISEAAYLRWLTQWPVYYS